MNIATLFLLSTLVLRSGHHIDIDGPWHEDHGRILFRTADGTLYSVPKDEVDLETTRAMSVPPIVAVPAGNDRAKLKVSEEEKKRLIAALEENHTGVPATQRTLGVEMVPADEPRADNGDEWTWRNRARDYEERIRQARENRDLIASRIDALRGHIASLVSLGYRPWQFSYDSTTLQALLEQLPLAELEIKRAERAYAQFRDDARRMGILPGWLR